MISLIATSCMILLTCWSTWAMPQHSALTNLDHRLFKSVDSGVVHPKNYFKQFNKRNGPPKASSSLKDGFLKIGDAPPKMLEARQYGKTVLECSASGNPAPQIMWYKDGKPLIPNYSMDIVSDNQYDEFSLESMSETKSRISLDCVSEEDAGLYECVARTNKKRTSVGTEVQVVSFESTGCIPRRDRHRLTTTRSAPVIFQWMGTYMQVIGSEAHLICRAEGGTNTYWIGPDDQDIPSNSGKYNVLENGDLLIRDLSFEDMGLFKCIVRNEFGEDMKETFVYPHTR